jgi:hypothetical protein
MRLLNLILKVVIVRCSATFKSEVLIKYYDEKNILERRTNSSLAKGLFKMVPYNGTVYQIEYGL